MEIKNKKATGNSFEFELKGSDEVFANTLRRTLISNIPVFAAEKIAIINNNSPMYDEHIAHRIAMIPFTYSDKYNNKNNCECEHGCDKCNVTLTLKKKGKASVYSGDFKSSDRNVVPVCKDILITRLEEDMNFEIEATLITGTLKEHSKFQNSITSTSYETPDNIRFKIKAITGRKPRDMLLESVDILKDKLAQFKKEIEKTKEIK
ncbi:MAG: DNA-directed RNA polymerase subunit D [Candidatus Aenigmarchaeota archaeon]|nr:DNA-directed RNA polymerase subunit D [Candidatus Aenigmarchaeota archaeon]